MQHVVTRHRVTGRIAGSYSRVHPIDAEVLRVARRVKQPINEYCACEFAGPDVHCSYEAGGMSQQEIVASMERCARAVIPEFKDLSPTSSRITMQASTRAQGSGGGGNHAVRCDAPPQVAVCRRKHHR
jgi:hypothetical protein